MAYKGDTMLQTKMISSMKMLQDRMDNLMPVTEMNQYLDVLKDTGATHIDVTSVIGHPNFLTVAKQWAEAIHAKGLKATWRCPHGNMNGLYGMPKFVGVDRKPMQFWIDEAVKAATTLGALVKAGDEWAIYPERTEGLFQDATAWLFDGLPNSYAQFFIDMHNGCKAVLPQGVVVGLSGNNASELLSGWMPQSLIDYAGCVVIDHYVDGDVAKYEADIRAINTRYGKPVYVQEGAPHRFVTPTYDQATVYFDTNKGLADSGILTGFGSWSGWVGTPEAILVKENGVYDLNDQGIALSEWWDPAVFPKEQVIQIYGASPMLILTDRGNVWKLASGKWSKVILPDFS